MEVMFVIIQCVLLAINCGLVFKLSSGLDRLEDNLVDVEMMYIKIQQLFRG